jgi:predicted nucleic acid-binding protein
VADAGPLIHLDEIQLASALGIFDEVLVPPQVAAEIQARARGPGNAALKACVIQSSSKEPNPMGALSIADVAAIQLAREHDAILLTDDLDLREAAHLAGLHVVGSVGIIVRAGRTGTLSHDAARAGLQRLLPDSTLFITPKLVEQAIAALAS